MLYKKDFSFSLILEKMDLDELKRFDFSGLEGKGWIERINPENPRLVDFILRTNLGEMMKNKMFSLDMPPIFSSASYESRMNAISDITTLVSNKLFEIPLLVKLPLKVFGVKTVNRMDAYRFLERFIVKTPVILPSFITLQKASTDSCCSSFDKTSFGAIGGNGDNKKEGQQQQLFEFNFKILQERCTKTNLNLVKLFSKTTSFEDLIDKKGSDGFVKSRKIKSVTAAAASKTKTKNASSRLPPTPTRKNAFLKGTTTSLKKGLPSKTQEGVKPATLEHQILSPRVYLTSHYKSPTSPLSISKFPTVISSDSCSSSDLKKERRPVKRLPPLPLLIPRRLKLKLT